MVLANAIRKTIGSPSILDDLDWRHFEQDFVVVAILLEQPPSELSKLLTLFFLELPLGIYGLQNGFLSAPLAITKPS